MSDPYRSAPDEGPIAEGDYRVEGWDWATRKLGSGEPPERDIGEWEVLGPWFPFATLMHPSGEMILALRRPLRKKRET